MQRHPLAEASRLAELGREGEALALLEPFRHIPDPKLHLLRAHWLRTTGDRQGSIEALRKVTLIEPRLGNAWLGLADLKIAAFRDDEVQRMKDVLADPSIQPRDRFLIHFALGKALEDRSLYEEAFEHFSNANRLQRLAGPADPFDFSEMVARQKNILSAEFFEQRTGCGSADRAPIFIVGMHRSGSTLLEQILSSHPEIEGTDELPYVGLVANQLRQEGRSAYYVDRLPSVEPDRFVILGQQYLREADRHRQLGKPRFIDKRPGNWLTIGLIHLMLPAARIIDMRRNPLDCCLANFKQFFEVGDMLRDLGDLGRFYRSYTSLMSHIDDVLPGRVHRVHYEALVADPENEVRRLLSYLNLDYDPACHRFYENPRAVRTPSAEQVRQPISRSSIGRWRSFKPWLAPLKESLGPELSEYPHEF